MPADQEVTIAIGRDGLNLRDQPVEVPISELTDSLNWRIDENGSLVKRLGYVTYAESGQLPAVPLEMTVYNPTNGTNEMIFYCADGHVYSSPGDGTFTSIASSLSTTARPSFAMLDDKLYWANGTDVIQEWDGTTLTATADGDAPKGKYLAVWRNRLWVSGDEAHPRRVYWSDILLPLQWNPLNYVDLAEVRYGDEVTGMIAAPNIGNSFDGADGILVYMRHSTRRIFDDTDNSSGAILGGSNVLIDVGTGTDSNRSLVALNGRIYSICASGIYSTDGHAALRLESARLGSFFADGVNPAQLDDSCATAWKGEYWAVFAASGFGANNTVLEVYTAYPRGGDQQHPVMALNLPIAHIAVYPSQTGNQLMFCDSTSGQTKWVRQYGVGGADTQDETTQVAISCSARSGNSAFGTVHPKHIRRVQALGRGSILIGASAELEGTVGETKLFQMAVAGPSAPSTPGGGTWGDGGKWGDGTWGGGGGSGGASGGGVAEDSQWYTKRGRLFAFTVSETSTDSASTGRRLGAAAQPTGGASLYALTIRTVPLDSE